MWELAVKIGALEARVHRLEKDVSTMWSWALRSVILLVLWIAAVLSNLSAETIAQLLTGVLKAL
jgi:hypothetical protein